MRISVELSSEKKGKDRRKIEKIGNVRDNTVDNGDARQNSIGDTVNHGAASVDTVDGLEDCGISRQEALDAKKALRRMEKKLSRKKSSKEGSRCKIL